MQNFYANSVDFHPKMTHFSPLEGIIVIENEKTADLLTTVWLSLIATTILSSLWCATATADTQWQKLQTDLLKGVEDRTNVFNDFFNDEAPQYHPTGWQMPNSRFMAIAQGSHLLSDHNASSVTEWQDRHQHPHEQWTDLVLEGNPTGQWRYFINANITEKDMILDEAYINLSLGAQWQVKAGQFFSAFGRLNSQHVHDRDFVDAPIIYQRLFGTGTALQETGLQVTYSLPVNLSGASWILGGELLSTTNREQFNQDQLTPNLHHIFSKWGQSYRQDLYSLIGISWAMADMKTPHGLLTKTDWQAIDFTLKQWLPQQRYWMLQGEWLNRQSTAQTAEQSVGYYLMGLYRLNEQWRIGARHERADTLATLPIATALPDTTKDSLVVEYDPTSWSRMRLQLGVEQQASGVEGSYLLFGWQMGVHWLE
jgi:hypothetical protein